MSPFYFVGPLGMGALADQARTGILIRYLRDADRAGDAEPLKLLAEVGHGAQPGVPPTEIDEPLRRLGIAPTEEEEERIARGETVAFLIDG